LAGNTGVAVKAKGSGCCVVSVCCIQSSNCIDHVMFESLSVHVVGCASACSMSLPDVGTVVSSCMFVSACSVSLYHANKLSESLRDKALVGWSSTSGLPN
jgi:hypothetical protein